MFGLLGFCSLLGHSAEILLVKLLIISVFVTVSEVVDVTFTSSLTTIPECLFSIFLTITFTWYIDQFFLLKTFSFPCPQTFLFINLISSSFKP